MISPMVDLHTNTCVGQSIMELGKKDLKIIQTALIALGAIAGFVTFIGVVPVPLFGRVIEVNRSMMLCAKLTSIGCNATNELTGVWKDFFEETLGKVHNALL
ncbi:hypothetical protein PHSC3_000700 [Chlamydiales bacterium STE3]|nr:hypothetical protein PHSC3_000700 [Chlamydiales bacterium STE3]